jgi:ABC-2 type transport system permease protein
MGAIWAIAAKDIRLLLRDRMGFFFAFVFPILTAIFFGTIFGSGGGGGDGKIDVLLVDEDNSAGSRAFVETLHGASEIAVTDSPNRAEAERLVATGKSPAFVVLPKGFGATRDSMFFGAGSSIVLGVDPSHRAESGMLEGVLTKYGFMRMQDAFKNPAMMQDQVKKSMDAVRNSAKLSEEDKRTFSKFFDSLDQFLVDVPRIPDDSSGGSSGVGAGGWQPIKIEKADVARQPEPGEGPRPPPNAYAWTFPQGMIWGFIGCSMSFAVALVLERTRGTLPRLRVAPLGPMQVLAGKALACFVMTQVVVVLLMVIAGVVFGVRPTSYPKLAVAMLCTGCCFVGLMLLFSVLSKSERAAAGLGWGAMLIFSMIGGGMIPLFVLRSWMKSLSMLSPVRWSILALEGGVWRQPFGWSDMALPCSILIGIGIVGFVAGAIVFGRAENA